MKPTPTPETWQRIVAAFVTRLPWLAAQPSRYAVWQRIVAESIIGTVGHHRTFEGGPAHPSKGAPKWVTPRGVNLKALHAAHSAFRTHAHRGEDAECTTSAVRVRRATRVRRGPVLVMRRRTA